MRGVWARKPWVSTTSWRASQTVHPKKSCPSAWRQVSTSSEALSGVYAVLGRRRSRILREEMREGSDLFIGAHLGRRAVERSSGRVTECLGGYAPSLPAGSSQPLGSALVVGTLGSSVRPVEIHLSSSAAGHACRGACTRSPGLNLQPTAVLCAAPHRGCCFLPAPPVCLSQCMPTCQRRPHLGLPMSCVGGHQGLRPPRCCSAIGSDYRCAVVPDRHRKCSRRGSNAAVHAAPS